MVLGSASSMVLGNSWAGTILASVQTHAFRDPGVLRLNIADFPPLQAGFGAVRLAFASLGQVSPMPPIIVSRDDADFFVVSAECTHQSCLIPAFAATKTSTCPCHGSRFGHDGRVIRGPANSPLPRYDLITEDPAVLQILLPEIASYDVTIQRVTTPGTNRLALGFRSMPNVDYEVLSRTSPSSPWQARTFAISEAGPADRTSVKGNGSDQVVYVESDGSSGLFAVSAKVKQV
jgi:nitrite reductase/ring-hydroxylating ferredoxin subunit